MEKKSFKQYKKNLTHDSDYVYSYNTKVAAIHTGHLEELGKWSKTTNKHVRYAAKELKLLLKSYTQ
tara:strand:- start:261 stop:458 length:198 start_codon:yes stop_codon:yes gene_type:complete